MQKGNPLSVIGRSGYLFNILLLPGVYTFYKLVYAPYSKAKADQAKAQAAKGGLKAMPVDPDLCNPFTPIPYHNNYQLKYALAHINMHNYINENGINVKDYPYKQYHDAFDHNNQRSHLYNYTSVYGPPGYDAKFRKEHGSGHHH